MLAVLGAIGVGEWNASAATTFAVTNNGFAAYVVGGVDNPTLTLTRGQTYTFDVNADGHPFWITTARGAGDTESNAYEPGVTGNGPSVGTITFVVPATAPATLYYQCAYHTPMGGTLLIVNPPSVPSLGRSAVIALAGLLALAAVIHLRRRVRA